MVVRVLYGKPAHSKELEHDLQTGRVVFGGNHPTEQDPRYQCMECSVGWTTYPKRRID
jgi:hypothetical protein